MATNIAPCLPRVRGRGEGGRGSFDELCRLIPPRRDSGRTLLRIVSSSLQSSRENERISVGKNVFSFFRKFSRPTRIERSRVSTLTCKQGVKISSCIFRAFTRGFVNGIRCAFTNVPGGAM